jgi:hypothetical protein
VNWFQGNAKVFAAQSGAANAYAGVNFNSVAGDNTISDWLITPTLTFENGDVLSFFTRTVDTPSFADRLEVRFSDVGGTDVGTTATSVGTFRSLLLEINPNLSAAGYPKGWTNNSATITGLAAPASGAIGFRCFVTNGGLLGANSDYIGIDTVTIEGTRNQSTVPEPGAFALLGIGLAGLGFLRRKNKGFGSN